MGNPHSCRVDGAPKIALSPYIQALKTLFPECQNSARLEVFKTSQQFYNLYQVLECCRCWNTASDTEKQGIKDNEDMRCGYPQWSRPKGFKSDEYLLLD